MVIVALIYINRPKQPAIGRIIEQSELPWSRDIRVSSRSESNTKMLKDRDTVLRKDKLGFNLVSRFKVQRTSRKLFLTQKSILSSNAMHMQGTKLYNRCIDLTVT